MKFLYKFVYTSSNQILSYFLDFYAKKYSLNYEICEKKDEISLFIEGNESEILAFNDESMPKIPHFLFLNNFKVEICENLESGNFKQCLKFPNITPNVAEIYKHSAQISSNEFGILSEISVFYENNFVKIDENNFFFMLEFAINSLKNSNPLILKDAFGEFELHQNIDFTSDFLLCANLKEISKIFVADEKSQFALASFEKPLVYLRLNAIYRKNHPNSPHNFWLKAARDLFTYALCDEIYKFGTSFLSINFTSKTQNLLKIFTLENEFALLSSTYYLNLDLQNLLKTNTPLNIAKLNLNGKKGLFINLNKTKDDEIALLDENSALKMINIKIPCSFDEIKNQICKDEIGKKLFANFTKHFKFPNAEISAQNGFFSLFCIIEKMLNFSRPICQNADENISTKGAAIDFKLKNKNELDTALIIKNAMSYALAEVDEKIFSFGLLYSLVLFIREISDEIKEKYGSCEIFITGELFESKTLCHLCKKHLGIKFNNEIPLLL